jgi:DNA-binding CsgD family transcriptional regulator
MASREDGQPLAAALWVTAMAAAWLGQEQTCRDAASRGQAVSHETGDGLFDMACKVAVGFLELTLGRPEAAWPLLAAACEALERQGFREPSCFPALPLAVEAAVAVGDGSEARRLLARLAEQGELLNSRWADASVLRCQGHLVAEEDPTRAVGLFETAGEAFDALGLPLEFARCLLARGTVLRRVGQKSAARAHLSHALGLFVEADARVLADAARAEIARIGGRGPGDSSILTASERQVAELVVRGLSNKQVAARMTVSVKTVESHLTHIYQKLGVRSRTALAASLAGRHL